MKKKIDFKRRSELIHSFFQNNVDDTWTLDQIKDRFEHYTLEEVNSVIQILGITPKLPDLTLELLGQLVGELATRVSVSLGSLKGRGTPSIESLRSLRDRITTQCGKLPPEVTVEEQEEDYPDLGNDVDER